MQHTISDLHFCMSLSVVLEFCSRPANIQSLFNIFHPIPQRYTQSCPKDRHWKICRGLIWKVAVAWFWLELMLLIDARFQKVQEEFLNQHSIRWYQVTAPLPIPRDMSPPAKSPPNISPQGLLLNLSYISATLKCGLHKQALTFLYLKVLTPFFKQNSSCIFFFVKYRNLK